MRGVCVRRSKRGKFWRWCGRHEPQFPQKEKKRRRKGEAGLPQRGESKPSIGRGDAFWGCAGGPSGSLRHTNDRQQAARGGKPTFPHMGVSSRKERGSLLERSLPHYAVGSRTEHRNLSRQNLDRLFS